MLVNYFLFSLCRGTQGCAGMLCPRTSAESLAVGISRPPVSMKEWGNGWGEVWFSSTVVAMFVVTWPAALAGSALNYLQAVRDAGRLTDRKRTGTGQGAGAAAVRDRPAYSIRPDQPRGLVPE